METLILCGICSALAYGLAYRVHGSMDPGERALLTRIREVRHSQLADRQLEEIKAAWRASEERKTIV